MSGPKVYYPQREQRLTLFFAFSKFCGKECRQDSKSWNTHFRFWQGKCMLWMAATWQWVRWQGNLLLVSHSVMSNSLIPHGLQHTRLPCPSPSPGACSNSYPLSQWYHPTISSSVAPDTVKFFPLMLPVRKNINKGWTEVTDIQGNYTFTLACCHLDLCLRKCHSFCPGNLLGL